MQMNREVQRNPVWSYQKGSSWKGQCKSKGVFFSFPARVLFVVGSKRQILSPTFQKHADKKIPRGFHGSYVDSGFKNNIIYMHIPWLFQELGENTIIQYAKNE